MDHEDALLLDLAAEPARARHLRVHRAPGWHHQAHSRPSPAFLDQVCAAAACADEVLVVGPRQALSEFGHYVREHQPACAERFVGYDVIDHPTEAQLAAHARAFFARRDHLADIGALPQR